VRYAGLNPLLAGHAEPRTTTLYDRRKKVTRNIVERIAVGRQQPGLGAGAGERLASSTHSRLASAGIFAPFPAAIAFKSGVMVFCCASADRATTESTISVVRE
jgi:hypothetical protein